MVSGVCREDAHDSEGEAFVRHRGNRGQDSGQRWILVKGEKSVSVKRKKKIQFLAK